MEKILRILLPYNFERQQIANLRNLAELIDMNKVYIFENDIYSRLQSQDDKLYAFIQKH